MGNEVQIVLSAVDKASRVIKDVDKETNKLASGAAGLKSALTTAGVALGVVTAAALAVKNALNETVGVTVTYANTVRQTSVALGLTADETSRVIQVFDDFGISAEKVQTALSMAAKNGFAPSIENLATLSDEIIGMKDPTERAARLSKIFGRNWQEVNEVLMQGGDVLREQSDAINDNLILTEEQVKASRAYELAMDDLNDTVMGLKVSIGNELIPTLVELASELNDGIQGEMDYEKVLKNTTGTYDEYIVAVRKAYEKQMLLKTGIKGLDEWLARESVKMDALTEEQYAAAKAADEMASAFRREQMAADKFAPVVEELNTNTIDLSEATDHYTEMAEAEAWAMGQAEDAAAKLNDELIRQALDAGLDGTLSEAWEAYNEAVATGADNQAELMAAVQKTTAELIYQTAAQGLDANAAMLLANKLGLLSDQDYELVTATQTLNAAYDPSKPNLYAQAVAYLAAAAADGTVDALELAAALDILNGKRVDTWVYTHQVTVNENYVPGQVPTGDYIPMASGGDFITTGPTRILAGEAGPERVTVTPINNTTYNYNIHTNAGGSSLLRYAGMQRGR